MLFSVASRNHRIFRITLSLFAVIALSTFSGFFTQTAVNAQTPPAMEEGKKVTIHTAAPIREVLENLLRSQAASCVIGPGVEGIVTVHLTDVSFEEALNYLLTSTTPELTYTRDKNNVYVIKVKPKGTEQPVINVNNTIPQSKPDTADVSQPSILLTGADSITQALQLQLINLQIRRSSLNAAGFGDDYPIVHETREQIFALQQAIQDRLHPKPAGITKKKLLPVTKMLPTVKTVPNVKSTLPASKTTLPVKLAPAKSKPVPVIPAAKVPKAGTTGT